MDGRGRQTEVASATILIKVAFLAGLKQIRSLQGTRKSEKEKLRINGGVPFSLPPDQATGWVYLDRAVDKDNGKPP